MKQGVSVLKSPKNCQMGQKAGRQENIIGQTMRNKEEINRKYLISWGRRVTLVWNEKEQGNTMEPSISLAWCLDVWVDCFLSRRAFAGARKIFKFQVTDGLSQARKALCWAQKCILATSMQKVYYPMYQSGLGLEDKSTTKKN